jgi:hypothetical protein
MIEEYIGRQEAEASATVALPFDFKCYTFGGRVGYVGLYDRRSTQAGGSSKVAGTPEKINQEHVKALSETNTVVCAGILWRGEGRRQGLVQN